MYKMMFVYNETHSSNVLYTAAQQQHSCMLFLYTAWAKLNGVNAVSFVVVNHVLENSDIFWQVK